jgi:hypothetical protein
MVRSLAPPTSWPHDWDFTAFDELSPVFVARIGEQSYAFFFFSVFFWLYLVAVTILECIVAAPFAFLLYAFTVRPQKPSKRRRVGTTWLGYFVGWGTVIFWIFAPRIAVEFIHVKNLLIRFTMCVLTPTVSIFRSLGKAVPMIPMLFLLFYCETSPLIHNFLEAMYGLTPEYTLKSAFTFSLYFSSPMMLNYDHKYEKLVKASPRQILNYFYLFLSKLALAGTYQSMFLVFKDHFPSLGRGSSSTPLNYYQFSNIYNLEIWKDSILIAVLLQMYLSVFASGLCFATALLTKKQTAKFDDNPLFASQSPSDFWGRRWNLLIHRCLKNGVYKPVRAVFDGHPILAILSTFMASGLFHEWLLPTVFWNYPSTHGITLLFFLWQAALVILEGLVGLWLAQSFPTLPKALRTVLVILMGLPLAHWFYDTYLRSDFFLHGQVGLPMIVPVAMGSYAH